MGILYSDADRHTPTVNVKSNHSGDPKSGHVRFLNGQEWIGCQMPFKTRTHWLIKTILYIKNLICL